MIAAIGVSNFLLGGSSLHSIVQHFGESVFYPTHRFSLTQKSFPTLVFQWSHFLWLRILPPTLNASSSLYSRVRVSIFGLGVGFTPVQFSLSPNFLILVLSVSPVGITAVLSQLSSWFRPVLSVPIGLCSVLPVLSFHRLSLRWLVSSSLYFFSSRPVERARVHCGELGHLVFGRKAFASIVRAMEL